MGLDGYSGRRGVIVHHWDTDGIASAAIVQKKIGSQPRIVPEIGNFFVSDDTLAVAKMYNPDFMIIVDMALPDNCLVKLKTVCDDILLLDHHAGKPDCPIERVNPVAEGGDASKWPSAGWVINDWLGKPQDIYSVLGAIGDRGDKMREDEVVERVLAEVDMSFEDALKVTQLLDSNYIVNDIDGIGYAVELASLDMFHPMIILASERFGTNLKRIEEELERLANEFPGVETDGILVFDIRTDFHLISRFTREMSAANPEHLVMVVDASKGSIYTRRGNLDVDLSQLIPWGKEVGDSSGGKKEVLGLQCRPELIPEIKDQLIIKLGEIKND